ncbi:MAG: hypothetical protein A2W00_12135 [Candidatus Eisenbacteria bacterium RBG_16_71_46]|nr:MAG: hypothetical protein A2W00_12135 [Candidatus Eisenbacteria bacterium RBG_16_71_46]
MLRRRVPAWLAWLALSLAGLAFAAGCATNPVTGRREFSLVSADRERQIGREGHTAIVAEYGAYPDPALQALVDSVGWKLARVSELPGLDWHFTVLDDPVVNAFALPGGYIYVTRGILAHLNSEAQLAGVLGHEIGHVTARHSAQRLTYQQLAGVGLGLASIFSEGFRRYSGAAETALGLVFLKYGRDDENQADELGVRYSTAAGFDPREMPSTYAMLERVGERAGQRLPAFLSTHPDPGDRQARTTALSREAAAGRKGLVIAGRAYVQALEGVAYGNDPRQGFFDGARYYHPTLQFQMAFPAGWKYQNGRAEVLAVAPGERAGMQLTLADTRGLAPAAYVADLQARGSVVAAGGAEPIGTFDAWVGRLQTRAQDGSQVVMAAAFVRKAADQTFQILGRSAATGDADERAIFTSARSFRALADPARLEVTPDHVHLVTVDAAGSFADVVRRQSAQAIGLDETAILNNAQPDEDLRAGQLLKIVLPGKRP